MSSKHLCGDTNYAWPTAEIAVMGAKVRASGFSLSGYKDSTLPARAQGIAGKCWREARAARVSQD